MRGVSLALAAALSLSATNIATGLHYAAGSTPMTFLVGRYALFVVGASLVLAALGLLRPVPRTLLQHAIGAGVLNAAGAVALAFAFARIEVGLAVLLLYLYPMLTELLVAALDRRKPGRRALVSLLSALAGLALALDVGRPAVDGGGVALAVLAAFAFSSSFVWADRGLGTLSNAMRVLALGFVGLVFVGALASVARGVVWPLPNVAAVTTLLAATSSFSIAYVSLFAAIALAGSPVTTRLMNLEPVATIALAWALLGETLSAQQLLGCLIVVIALLGSQSWRRAPSGDGEELDRT